MRHVPKEHQKTIRSGLGDSSLNGLHKFSSIDRRDKKEYALLVVRQLRARKVDLRCRVSSGGAISRWARKTLTSFVKFGMVLESLVHL